MQEKEKIANKIPQTKILSNKIRLTIFYDLWFAKNAFFFFPLFFFLKN